MWIPTKEVHKEYSLSVLEHRATIEPEFKEQLDDICHGSSGILFFPSLGSCDNEAQRKVKENWKNLAQVYKPFCVFLLYGSGGGGHLASAQALFDLIKERHPEWHCFLWDVTELAGISLSGALYNIALEWDLLPFVGALYSVAKVFRPLLDPVFSTRLKGRWKRLPKPDLVVSFVPFLNSAIINSLPDSQHITVMTDFTNTAAHPWLQDKRQKVLCGTVTSIQQAIRQGYDVSHLKPISGMVVHPRFYKSSNVDIPYLRRKLLGSNVNHSTEERLTILILIGAYPPYYTTQQIISCFSATCSHQLGVLNVICICGGNSRLYQELSRLKCQGPAFYRENLFLLGYTKQVAEYMRISDIIITKPGPGVVAESCVMKVPLIILTLNNQLMEQEEEVANWVVKHGIGRKIVFFDQLLNITKEQILMWKHNMESLGENRAVFEVLKELETYAK
ncbi:Monogalactosyldiacylglycerol synthase, chloroplastic [Galdieria sulphuraria]|nr:Monogalactosyldiacylglycerol synthase, chloroplastic [Galdieria sulphuraria]